MAKIRKLLIPAALVVLILFAGIFVYTSISIGNSVGQYCTAAQSSCNEKDCVSALIKVVEDEDNSFKERNSAIWALGQLGDKRALSTLEEMYTGNIPHRESYNAGISQYELKKAIKLLKGGFNATAPIWR